MSTPPALPSSPHEAAAALLRRAYHGHPCDPLRDRIGRTVDDGYAVQDINSRIWIAEGRSVCGYKIGLTSPAVQRQMGVDQPDFGLLFDDMDMSHTPAIAFERLHQPRAEAEIAFVLGKDLDRADLSIDDLAGSVAFAAPALEIVGSRIRGWDIGISDTIADNASSGVYVLGEARRPIADIDLAAVTMAMARNGEPVSTGRGADCLGSPLLAAHWLARAILGRGRPMLAGHILLTGALGPMVEVRPGDVFDVSLSCIGDVRATFTQANPAQPS